MFGGSWIFGGGLDRISQRPRCKKWGLSLFLLRCKKWGLSLFFLFFPYFSQGVIQRNLALKPR